MRFGLFSMAEYVNMIVLSGLCVTLFLGGWLGPVGAAGTGLVPAQGADPDLPLHLAARDAAAPALRPADGFGWKVLLPVATLNALVTAALVVAFS